MLSNIKLATFTLTLMFVSFVVIPHTALAQSKPIMDTLYGDKKTCNYIKNGDYMLFSDIDQKFPVFGKMISKDRCVKVTLGVNNMFQAGFAVFLSLVALIAVIRISVAGIQWMIAGGDSGAVSKAKKDLTGAIIGLILALGGWLILNTVNPKIVNDIFNLSSTQFARFVQAPNPYSNIAPIGGGTGGDPYNAGDGYSTDITKLPEYYNASTVKELLQMGSNGNRSDVINGGVAISLYSSAGDSTTDSNTAIGKGNVENLLIPGSVALSPDVITRLKPEHGQQILVNGVPVGYWDDTTADSYNGQAIRNTVDLYNPKGTYGPTNDTFKVIPGGQITVGPEIRTPTPFPTN